MTINKTNILRCAVKLPCVRKYVDGIVADRTKKLDKQILDYQKLVENLRQRISDADKQRKQTDRTLATLFMARQLLEKTNNTLTDFCNYMEIGNVEALREMTEDMAWSSVMLRIIKNYMLVLDRKNELEQRLTVIGNKQEWDNPNFD